MQSPQTGFVYPPCMNGNSWMAVFIIENHFCCWIDSACMTPSLSIIDSQQPHWWKILQREIKRQSYDLSDKVTPLNE